MTKPGEFHYFPDLPIEVRHLIYEFALVRGDIFIPNTINPHRKPSEKPQHDMRHSIADINGAVRQRYLGFQVERTPGGRFDLVFKKFDKVKPLDSSLGVPGFWGLTGGVCKLIHNEARAVLWSRNRVVFPAGYWESPMSIEGGMWADWVPKGPPPAKDLSFTFDMLDRNSTDYVTNYVRRCYATKLLFQLGDPKPDPHRIAEVVHDEHSRQIQEWWEIRCEAIREVASLRRLQLDFEDCYCIHGCCRLVYRVCEMLEDGWEGSPPEVFEILNWRGYERRHIVRILTMTNTSSKVVFAEPLMTELQELNNVGEGLWDK